MGYKVIDFLIFGLVRLIVGKISIIGKWIVIKKG